MSSQKPNIDQALAQARKLIKAGDLPAARALYQQILQKFPQNHRAQQGLAKLADLTSKPPAGTILGATLEPKASPPQTDISQAEQAALVRLHQTTSTMPEGPERTANLEKAVAMTLALQQKYPPSYFFSYVLGMTYFLKADYAAAIEAFETAQKFDPQNSDTYFQIGLAHLEMENMEAAQNAFANLIAHHPSHVEARKKLALCHLYFEQPEEAAAIYDQLEAASHDEADLEVLWGRGQIHLEQREFGAAVEQFSQARDKARDKASGDPNRTETHKDDAYINVFLGHVKALLGDNKPTIALAEIAELRQQQNGTALYDKKHDEQITLLEIEALRDSYRYADALTACDKLLNTAPDWAEIFNMKSRIYAIMGQRETALAQNQKSIASNKDYISTWVQRTNLIKYNSDSAQQDLQQLEKFLQQAEKSGNKNNQCAPIAMALGKIHNDLGAAKPAFQYYKQGNQIFKARYKYDMRHTVQSFQHMKDIFAHVTPTDVVDTDYEDKRKLIFVLGMPRSGTSLTEQILASHSQVYGGGELNYMNMETHKLTQLLKLDPNQKLAKPVFASIGRAYLQHLHTLDSAHPVLSDKLPHNFFRLGYILGAYPNAKIIHMNRDPMAVCWSHFQHRFKSKMLDYCYDLQDLGHYYGLYIDLMDYWREKFPNRIYELDYEKLTQQQEAQTRKLLAYCQLDWQDEVMDFHKNNRPVHTASQLQVKEKIYRGSSQAWQAYKDDLQPLAKALQENPYDIYRDNE